ncbi:T9SS type A sorting domain-containing protein [Confluentibacter flavum]|uniref:Peptidase M64 n=1 Tax=Confluentibacter flavum TaxID=1909700 RepID=A0A2N3HFH2_9FLAO|nr:M64 family metallopeptidase [Confluentibacter flavum]PKQ43518.1 peptidase M64 [Confluentibacter flavum]
MKHILPIVLFFSLQYIHAQVFDVEAIKISGDDDKRINLVILSEGYQASELAQFKTDATNFVTEMFNQSPFKEYANYFNVYIIKVPSNESGADHPGTATNVTEPASPIRNVDTYFNATYDSFGNHRLLYYEIDGYSSNNTQAKIMNVLATNFPTYDQALILVNSLEYGGSGGLFPMAYKGSWGSRVIIHELGHSLFNLKDEYYPGDILAAEAINMTQETNPSSVRWKNWISSNGVGVYQYTCVTGNCADWYKPHQNCIMESIDKTFCSVCKEGMIEKIHSMVSPIDSYTPVSNSINNPTFPADFQLDLIHPIPNTLESTWTLNTAEFAVNVDAITISETNLTSGINTLTVAVTDATPFLKVDNHDAFHVYTVTWSIDNSALGIEDITSEVNNFNISIYPNPSNSLVTIDIENSLNTDLKVDFISLEGKKVKTVTISNYEPQQIDISYLSQGIYIVNFYANNVLIASKKVVKN